MAKRKARYKERPVVRAVRSLKEALIGKTITFIHAVTRGKDSYIVVYFDNGTTLSFPYMQDVERSANSVNQDEAASFFERAQLRPRRPKPQSP